MKVTVEEAIAARQALEKQLLVLLSDFKKHTGVTPREVNLQLLEAPCTAQPDIIDVHIVTRI